MKPNPIATTNHCLQGNRLPRDWQQQAKQNAENAEAAYMDRIQNAWKKQSLPGDSPAIQNCRLRSDSGDHPHNHKHPPHNGNRKAQIRVDGEMVLIEERSDGWQCWKDCATGSTIWRRIDWSDLFGRR